jgi:hypothetical protein
MLNGNKEGEVLEEHTLFTRQFKGKCRNCGQISHKVIQRKKKKINNVGIDGNMTGANYCVNCRKTGHVRKNCHKLKKKESQYASNENGSRDRQMYISQDVVFTATSENIICPMTFGFATVVHVDTTISSRRDYLMFRRFVRISQLETVEP